MCVFNIRGYMCLCLIKLTPTESLGLPLTLIYSFNKNVLNSFDVLVWLLDATDIKMTNYDPFPDLLELRIYWEKQIINSSYNTI